MASFNIASNACGPYVLQPSDNSVGPNLTHTWSILPAATGAGLSGSSPSFTLPASLSDSVVYTVFLSVSDDRGCMDTLSKRFTLYPIPESDFALSRRDSCGPLTVIFSNLSSSGQSGMDTTTLSFAWDLGNGSNITANTPSPVTYTNSNTSDTTYYISLITTNAFACSDTLVDSVIVRSDPLADFSATTYLECAPFQIDTSIISWTDYPLINSGYIWEIFDSNGFLLGTGTDPNTISHSINFPAESIVLRLIAVSPFGCADDTLERSFQTIPNPVPNFTILNPQGCSPLSLNIVDSSSVGVSYEWFVDNQLVSTNANPNLTLTNTGRIVDSLYTVKLIVTAGGTGCKDSVEHTVTVFALPEANFSVAPVCEVESLFFNDLSTSIDTVVAWYWDFGDGTIDSSQNPVHLYSGYGWQNVGLTVTDSRGCSHTFFDSVLVYPNPIAIITKSGNCEPQNICKGQSVSLLDSSFVDTLGAPITSWAWDVDGDGIIDYNVQNPSHNFSDTGSTTVHLYVQSIYGCVDSISLIFNVLDIPDIAFDFDTTANCGPLTVNLLNQSTSRIDFSEWTIYTLDSLGSRQIMLNDTSRFLTTPVTLLPSYLDDTTYYFELISGNCCGSDTLTKSILLKPLPVAAMLASSVEGCTPFPVNFQLDGLVKGLPDYLIMNFGNGRVDTILQNFLINSIGDTIYVWGQQSNTFINPLNYDTTYVVSLTAVNDCGDSTVTIDILVHPNTVQAFFQPNPVNGCQDLQVNFQDFSFGGSNISWCFDYDTLSNSCNQPVAIGTSFTHTYSQAGTYIVAQFVDDGCSYDTAFQIITVYPAPVAAFSASNFLCEGDTVIFSDQSLANGASISSYLWTFGDGDSSYLTNPIHVYDTAGTFTIKLLISSANGCLDSIYQSLTIYDKPDVDFGYTNACLNEQPIQFTDSTSLNSGTIISTLWDFGDGNTSVNVNPLHNYAAPGLYRVSLIKISSNGCIDSAFHNINVFPEPQASFTYTRLSDDSCSLPQQIDFINQSQGAQGFLWDFDFSNNPGQETSTLVNPQYTFNNFGIFQVALFAHNQFGCIDTIIRTIQISTVPEAGFIADTLSGCQPLLVNFTDTSQYNFNGPGGVNAWFWDFGDGGISTILNPSHVFQDFGSFQTSLIVTTDAGCSDTVLGPIIEVYPRPGADFQINQINVREFKLINTSLNTDSSSIYLWRLGDGSTSSLRSPSHRYRYNLTEGSRNLSICLRVENTSGCTDSICVNLELRSLQLNVPNAFVPELNVDSDANLFLPKGHSLREYTLRVYDKWGNIVFETNVLDEEGKPVDGWDGNHYQNATPLPMGSYTWRIDAVFNDGTVWFGKRYGNGTQKNVGSVTLIR
jgi:PKD repeat protein